MSNAAYEFQEASIRARVARAAAFAGRDSEMAEVRRVEIELCRRDVFHFIDNWVWTYNPKLAAIGLSATLPLDLFPRQRQMVQFILDRLAAQEDGLIEKSRDIGFTWVAGAVAIWAWLFKPGFKTSFGSRKEDLVDRRDDPDSIFEKMRYLLRGLPQWMMPDGFDWKQHDNHMRLSNPDNRNVIVGEAGREMGRGGRATLYFLDEAAFLEDGDSVDAATAANSDVRIWGSTVNGMGNTFARKRHGGQMRPDQIFRFHWSDDPRKTPEWAAKKRKSMEAHKWASEYDIDYSASVEGVCIPAKWVQAAIELRKMWPMERPRKGIAGLDVGGGGSGKSVFVSRFGPLVDKVESWGTPDTIDTAHKGLRLAVDTKYPRADGFDSTISVLAFDTLGVGMGVQAVLKRHEQYQVQTLPVASGDRPSETEWPDGKLSEEIFVNLRAEMWWMMRSRFKSTYEFWCLLVGEPGGQAHPIDECILLPDASDGPDYHVLISQLSLPLWYTNEKGKIVIESKKRMAERGIPSPDHADALALTCYPNPDPLEAFRRMARLPVYTL